MAYNAHTPGGVHKLFIEQGLGLGLGEPSAGVQD